MNKFLLAITCVVYGFDPSVRPRCLITGQATEGWNQFNSPQFPDEAGQTECMYIIAAPEGRRIEFNFPSFNLLGNANHKCTRQGLAYLDPAQTATPGVTRTLCGNQLPRPMKSTGDKAFFYYTSKLAKGSFLVKYRLLENEVTGVNSKKTPTQRRPTNMKSKKDIVQRKPKSNSVTKPTARRRTTMRANFDNDNPEFDKVSMLGSKTDMDNKKMIKYGIIGMGFLVGAIIIWLMVRKAMGIQNGGIPEPEVKLPEGTIPTHVKAIQDYKDKLKSLGREIPTDG